MAETMASESKKTLGEDVTGYLHRATKDAPRRMGSMTADDRAGLEMLYGPRVNTDYWLQGIKNYYVGRIRSSEQVQNITCKGVADHEPDVILDDIQGMVDYDKHPYYETETRWAMTAGHRRACWDYYNQWLRCADAYDSLEEGTDPKAYAEKRSKIMNTCTRWYILAHRCSPAFLRYFEDSRRQGHGSWWGYPYYRMYKNSFNIDGDEDEEEEEYDDEEEED